ncbi:hypothetical protein CEP51_003328 [Fusarium floridanum]|uniref:Helicase ATP-binding domain-containing protein n=1 Tax=Fusarium floridanum TaxID=1325733 RepID=A0A428S7G1_9HYPO|nr:hypothetical protein CEP51_003328 [Fusarium floridanum]
MVDETHERTKNTDLLLALLKQVMGIQLDLKVVVISATVDLIISTRCPTCSTPRDKPTLSRSSLRETTPDCRKATIKGVAGVAQTKPEGSILVPGLQVLPLHSSLSRTQMEGVVDTNTGRKCSVSTNVAEASLTIGGITFMIGDERQSVDH